MELHGKVAVVTGASSGIGSAAARALAAEGMTVVAVARRGERLDALAAEVPGVVAHVADVTDDDAVGALASAVRADHGACHVLVNNAGFSTHRRFSGADGSDPVADLAAVLDVNLFGAARCMAAFEDLLVASAPARVVNVASMAGKVGVGPPAYIASKFALVGLTEAVRADWLRRGVAVCQLNPGYVRTEGFPQEDLRRGPLGRLVLDADPVAEAVVALARSGARERTVPRWYRAATVARHVAAPAFWSIARRFA